MTNSIKETLQRSDSIETLPTNKSVSFIERDVEEKGHIIGDWFIFRETRHFGPLSSLQIRSFLTKNLISTSHHVWRPGVPGWVAIKNIESFSCHGDEQIEIINDETFSSRAGLHKLDRIIIENRKLNFDEKKETEENKIKHQPVGIFTAITNSLNSSFGFDDKIKKWHVASTLFLFIACVAAYIGISQLPKESPALLGIPSAMKEKLITASETAESTSSPVLTVFEKTATKSDPVLVVGTNLPIGTSINIKITGDPNTLLNSFRFQKDIEMTITEKIFLTEAIRQKNGKFIPPGSYDITMTCSSCTDTKASIYKGKFSFGIVDKAAYNADLKEFHQKTRASAQLELNELNDLSNTLDSQYKNSLQKFTALNASDETFEWESFSNSWLTSQKKLVDLFVQIESAEFKTSLYYLDLYKQYSQVTKNLFEVHMLQDDYIISETKNEREIAKVYKENEKVLLTLKSLKSKLELMNTNFNVVDGLPSTTGI